MPAKGRHLPQPGLCALPESGEIGVILRNMELLASVAAADAADIWDRFRANGIPVLLVDDYAHPDDLAAGLSVAYHGSPPKWRKIYVCLDEQIEEAKLLFKDPNYEVKAPVDVAAFDKKLTKMVARDKSTRSILDENLNWIVGGLLVFVALAILVLAL
jgi:hypothetical protein